MVVVERRGCLYLNGGRGVRSARLLGDSAVACYPLSHSTGVRGLTLRGRVTSRMTLVASRWKSSGCGGVTLLPYSGSCCSGGSSSGGGLFKRGGMRVSDFLKLREPGMVGLTDLLDHGDDGAEDVDQPGNEALKVVGGLWSVVEHIMDSVEGSSRSLGCRRCRHS
jgi:hypothetical protein